MFSHIHPKVIFLLSRKEKVQEESVSIAFLLLLKELRNNHWYTNFEKQVLFCPNSQDWKDQ